MPKGGKRPGAGNPGFGKQIAVREGVERLTPRWFQMIEEMLNAKPDDGMTDGIKELAQQLIGKDSYTGKELIKWLARGAVEDRKFALDQLGKFMNKMIPTELTGKDGKDLPTPIINILQNAVLPNNSDNEDNGDVQKDTGSAGGNVSKQDDINPHILDSLSPKRQD